MAENKKKKPVSFFNSRLVSVISISLALFLMGLFLIVGLLGNELSVYMKENISFSIMLKDGVSDSEVKRTEQMLSALPYIKSTRYISKDEAAKDMVAELGVDPKDFLGHNPFQASIEAKLNAEYANIDSLKVIEKRLTASTNISQLLYQQDMMQIVNNNIKKIGAVLAVLIIVLILISFVLINNTIRLLIYSKRFLIYTMRLVGATPSFIRKPFIKYNITSGISSGILAICMLSGVLYYVQKQLIGIDEIIHWEGLLIIYAVIMALGIILSVVAAHLSVNRYLNMDIGKMYYI
ncbi:MAG: permease-like cell division protein FtsX [Tannerella sp.]|jgi:cell division transport system permease protein|nr:permease-like cell division protein FtsX [Tannerella sp.]